MFADKKCEHRHATCEKNITANQRLIFYYACDLTEKNRIRMGNVSIVVKVCDTILQYLMLIPHKVEFKVESTDSTIRETVV